jgi:PAS domain S-box-containing protein
MRVFASTDETRFSVEEKTNQWGSLFANSTLGVAITNSSFRFLMANPALLQMLGYTNQELQQQSFLDICVDEDRDGCRAPLAELHGGKRLHSEFEVRYRRKDGAPLPVDIHISTVQGQGQPTFLIVTVNLTARRAAEDVLRTAKSELTRVARLTTVGAMAASIAHEINQPLASIVMNGNAGLRWLARSEPNLREAQQAFERIINDSHRAAQIISGIRAMFRKESTERAPVAINELICDVVATLLGELRSRDVALALELLDDLSPVLADRVQLEQVLVNLVTNAIDSMTSVADRPRVLTIRSEQLDDWVSVSVQDTGTGIAPDEAERLFEAFYTTKPSGIGLGLSISRSIIDSHGGRLSAFPSPPHGSVFRIMLPARNLADAS